MSKTKYQCYNVKIQGKDEQYSNMVKLSRGVTRTLDNIEYIRRKYPGHPNDLEIKYKGDARYRSVRVEPEQKLFFQKKNKKWKRELFNGWGIAVGDTLKLFEKQ